jgi:hypothetical protein
MTRSPRNESNCSMRHRPEILVFFHAMVAATIISHCSRAAEPPEEIRGRFLSDYSLAANKLFETYTNYEVKFRSYVFTKGKKHYQFPGKDPGLVTVTRDGWKSTSPNLFSAALPKKVVQARNRVYEFTASEGNKGFVVNAISASNGDIGHPAGFAYWDRDTGRSYLEIAREASFTPISYTEAEFQGIRCKAYCATVSGAVGGRRKTTDQTFYFDPQADWVCLGWRAYAGSVEKRYTYMRVDGFPAPAPATDSFWSVDDSGAATCEGGLEYEAFRPITPPPESEFRLESIGLSEPDDPRQPKSWWKWYLFAAGILLAITLAIRFARRRSERIKKILFAKVF